MNELEFRDMSSYVFSTSSYSSSSSSSSSSFSSICFSLFSFLLLLFFFFFFFSLSAPLILQRGGGSEAENLALRGVVYYRRGNRSRVLPRLLQFTFKSKVVVDLRRIHWVSMVHMNVKQRSFRAIQVTSWRSSPHSGISLACLPLPFTEVNLLKVLSFNCSAASLFIEIASEAVTTIFHLFIGGYELYSEGYMACFHRHSELKMRAKSFPDAVSSCSGSLLMAIRNDLSFECIKNLEFMTPLPTNRCTTYCSGRYLCGSGNTTAVYLLADKEIPVEHMGEKCAFDPSHCNQECPPGLKGIYCSMRDCDVNNGACESFQCRNYTTELGIYVACECSYAHLHNDLGACSEEPCDSENECNISTTRCFKDIFNESGLQYTCQCLKGFLRHSDDKFNCIDVDECLMPNECHPAWGACLNLPGTYRCHCRRGYARSGPGSCRDRDECTNGEHECDGTKSFCVNTVGSYVCQCIGGHTKEDVHDKSCRDLDECVLDSDGCNAIESNCVNIVGSYLCICNEGYRSINETHCEDLDECDYEIHNCGWNTVCVNSRGSYECNCRDGTFKAGYDEKCVDIDECASMKPVCNLDSSLCVNLFGGFACKCLHGFLKIDNNTCRRATPAKKVLRYQTDLDDNVHAILFYNLKVGLLVVLPMTLLFFTLANLALRTFKII